MTGGPDTSVRNAYAINVIYVISHTTRFARTQNGFAFQAKCWNQALDKSVLLTKVYRQGDPKLLDILAEARVGDLSAKSIEVLRRHEAEPPPVPQADNGYPFEFTRLECKNRDVDEGNDEKLRALDGELKTFHAEDHDPSGFKLKSVQAPPILGLKIGAQVMLVKNLDSDNNLVNGSTGVVTRFVHWIEGKAEDPEFRLPKGWDSKMELPVVSFGQIDGAGGTEKVMIPRTWEITEGDKIAASRTQIPLRLAWVLSVHKSQGMTISHLDLNLRGVFEFGQAYVALSRGRCLKDIRIHNFDPSGFKSSGTVKEFYRALEEKQGIRCEEDEENWRPPATTITTTTTMSTVSKKIGSGSLTMKQRQMMEKKRQEALAKQRQRKGNGA